jgi:prophage regulatory protein
MSSDKETGMRLILLPEVMQKTGLSKASIYRAMARRSFPPAVRRGLRGVAWKEREIDEWGNSRPRAIYVGPGGAK